jgi:hypothetical protein
LGARLRIKERNEYEAFRAYYDWLCGMIPGWRMSHGQAVWQLFETPFTAAMELDENRAGDGMDLRNRYCWEYGVDPETREILQTAKPASVLEVMIALALRCQEEYMTRYDDLDPVEPWFGPMMESLGIAQYSDGRYDPIAVDCAVRAFLRRDYAPDGRGGLFYIPGAREDMRETEIWYQMLGWLDYYISTGGKRE